MVGSNGLRQATSLILRLRSLNLSLSHVIIAALALQFCVLQLLLNVQYGDAPRNLHWGLLTAQQPDFLVAASDPFVRIKGFPPEPPTLSHKALYETESLFFHPWWGPFFPLLFAGVWALSGSYAVLQQLVPLAAGATVVLVYVMAGRVVAPKASLLAAALFALMPVVREYAVISYVECLSAFVLSVALFGFATRQTVVAVLFGAAAVLAKRDTALLYLAIGLIVAVWDRWQGQRLLSLRYALLTLGIPTLLYAAWFLITLQRPPASVGGFSWDLFLLVVPQMIPLFFYTPWFAALPTLLLLGWLALLGWRRLPNTLWKPLLGAWTILGWIVLLVYAGTQGAGNSPRVIIPCLPPLAILVAAGLLQLSAPWRRRLGFYLIALFLAVNLGVTYFQYLKSRDLAAYRPAFAWLREQPRGFVLTDQYWSVVLYARQPVTWFEFDPIFEQNIMRSRTNFERYMSDHGIRYVILPPDDQLASADVRAFLDQRAQRHALGSMTVYRLY